ncbi:YfiR family protein [Congregicoccus parvus]|uniref:YfiR family protein n=1 Tax=Congregicoccus parvus TaxID=3081749 RepID=UPI003FA5C1C3
MNSSSMLLTSIKKLACAAALACVAAFVAPTDASAQSPEQIRAIFLFNFAKNVEWPADAFADAKAPIVVGVIRAHEVAEALDRSVRGKDANGREIVVKRIDKVEEAVACHMIFIGRNDRTAEFIEGLKGKPVLTVAEDKTFTEDGGMIKLFSDGAKVGCFVNVTASTSAGLQLSSRLVASKN